MGNSFQNTIFCCSWIKRRSNIHNQLKYLYTQKYQSLPLGNIALDVLKSYQNLDIYYDEEINLRTSIINSSYYDEQAIIVNAQGSDRQYPSSLSAMDPRQKQSYVRKLIKDSYLLVDLSDVFIGNSRMTYEKQIKRQILIKNQLTNSIVIDRQDVDDLIKQFDPSVINLLENYVKFCAAVKQQFSFEQNNFYSKLIANMKAHIIQQNKTILNLKQSYDVLASVEKLKDQIQNMCNILIDTVCIIFNKNIYRDSIQVGVVNFFEQSNLHTLMMSIIFDDLQFHGFLVKTIKTYFKKQLKKYKQTPDPADVVNDLFSNEGKQKKRQISQNKTKIMVKQLFQQKHNDINDMIFSKSRKTFRTINQKLEPIGKLKVIYELNKTIHKQYLALNQANQIGHEEYNHRISQSFTRQSISTIAKWLLYKQKNIETIVNLLLTYWFIHPRYRQSEKGSCLIPFVEQCENIVEWNV